MGRGKGVSGHPRQSPVEPVALAHEFIAIRLFAGGQQIGKGLFHLRAMIGLADVLGRQTRGQTRRLTRSQTVSLTCRPSRHTLPRLPFGPWATGPIPGSIPVASPSPRSIRPDAPSFALRAQPLSTPPADRPSDPGRWLGPARRGDAPIGRGRLGGLPPPDDGRAPRRAPPR